MSAPLDVDAVDARVRALEEAKSYSESMQASAVFNLRARTDVPALIAEVRRLRAALTPLELVQRARDAIGWRIGWAAKNGDGVAVGVFTRFMNAANDVLAYPARRALTGEPGNG